MGNKNGGFIESDLPGLLSELRLPLHGYTARLYVLP